MKESSQKQFGTTPLRRSQRSDEDRGNSISLCFIRKKGQGMKMVSSQYKNPAISMIAGTYYIFLKNEMICFLEGSCSR